MKRILLIILVIFFIPLPLLGDEVDEGLPGDTPARIKESARQVISLGVENKGVTKMTQIMLENNFREQQILEAHEMLMKAKRANLPEEPIMDKLHEGVAKQVRAENIIQAMEKVRSRYETASRYALRYAEDGERARVMTREIAECMTAGMGEGDIERIMEMLQKRRLKRDEAADLATETFRTARSMALTGVASRNIADVVDSAFQKGYGAGEMKKLGNAFLIQARTSSSPSDLAASYSDAIRHGTTANGLMEYGSGGAGSRGFGAGDSQRPGGFGNSGGFDDIRGAGGSAGSGGGGGGGRR
jgi:biopolymer transport protein ExbD